MTGIEPAWPAWKSGYLTALPHVRTLRRVNEVRGKAIDFVRAVAPARAHPTHDAVLSAPGQQFADNWLAQRGGTDYTRLTGPVEL